MTGVLQHDGSPVAASGPVDQLRARPILRSDDRQRLTFTRYEDPRSALARGLKEYLERVSLNWAHGRLLRFDRVLVCWGEPEVPAAFPSAVLLDEGPASYDDAQLAAKMILLDAERGDGTNRALRQTCEVVQTFALTLWATDPVERAGLVALVEDALDPADFMSGLRLELPYYFGARATYEKISLSYDDSSEDAQRRYRRAIMLVTASVTQYVPVGEVVFLRPRLEVDVDGVSDGATVVVE